MLGTIAAEAATPNHAAGDVLAALMTSAPGAVPLFLFGFIFLILGGVFFGFRSNVLSGQRLIEVGAAGRHVAR
ncbi:MAG: hypothetical protein JWQ12_132 [Glaciihabitans sp.]|nr:hypothetical protein [Glaciihabitans sp.]